MERKQSWSILQLLLLIYTLISMKTTLTLQGSDYIISTSKDGWYEVSGPDSFKFKRDEKFCWHFSKAIDADLKLLLLVNIVTRGTWGFVG